MQSRLQMNRESPAEMINGVQVQKAQASFASEQALAKKLGKEINEVQNDSQKKVSGIQQHTGAPSQAGNYSSHASTAGSDLSSQTEIQLFADL